MSRLTALSASLLAALLATGGAFAAEIPLDQRRSDSDFVSADTRAMQNDDTANPGMLAVLDGEAIWNAKGGQSGKSCADCHGDATASMKGVAARYPAFSAALNRPVDLEQRINLSRTDDQKATAFAYESKELLALTAYVAHQSRGLPDAVEETAQTKPFIAFQQYHPTGGANQLSDLPPRMAGSRLAATSAAGMHVCCACAAFRLRRAGAGRSRALPDVARPRPADGNAGGATVNNLVSRRALPRDRCREPGARPFDVG
jgi:mono/diheme cytochrome c family protein